MQKNNDVKLQIALLSICVDKLILITGIRFTDDESHALKHTRRPIFLHELTSSFQHIISFQLLISH